MPQKNKKPKLERIGGAWSRAKSSKRLTLIVVFFLTYFMITFVPLLFSGPLQINSSDTNIVGTNPRLTVSGTTKYVGYLDSGDLYVGNIASGEMILVNESVSNFDIAAHNSILHIVYTVNSYLHHAEWIGGANITSYEEVYGPIAISELSVDIADGGTIYTCFTTSSTVKMTFKTGSIWANPYLIPERSGTSKNPSLVCVGSIVYFVWTDTRNGQEQPFVRSFAAGGGFGSEYRVSGINDEGSGASIGFYSGLFYVFSVVTEGIKVYIGSSISSFTIESLIIKHTGLSSTYCSSSSVGLMLIIIYDNSLIFKTLTSSGWGISEQLDSAYSPDPDATIGLDTVYTKGTSIMLASVPSQTIETDSFIPIDVTSADDTVFDALTIENLAPDELNDELFQKADIITDGIFAGLDNKLKEAFPDVFETLGEAIPFVSDYPTVSLIISGLLGTTAFATAVFLPQFIYRRTKKRRSQKAIIGSEGLVVDSSFENY